MHLYWWKSEADADEADSAGPDGGPKCKGFVSLAAASCIVEKDADDAEKFSLQPSLAGWAKGRMEQHKSRTFKFGIEKGSAVSRDEWVAGIAAHIKQAESGKSTRLNALVQAFFMQPVADGTDKDG